MTPWMGQGSSRAGEGGLGEAEQSPMIAIERKGRGESKRAVLSQSPASQPDRLTRSSCKEGSDIQSLDLDPGLTCLIGWAGFRWVWV